MESDAGFLDAEASEKLISPSETLQLYSEQAEERVIGWLDRNVLLILLLTPILLTWEKSSTYDAIAPCILPG
jgi:hypothetical protein